MLRPLILSILLALAGLSAHQAMAQEPPAVSATLLANRIFLSGQGLLVAEGAVEVFYGTVRLSATRITYDSSGDRLSIEGPIRLTESGSIDSVLLADAAELSADLRDGILVSARMVLAQQLQLAANSIERREGRFTSFERVIASSCQICAANPTPLWEIRAARVTHDSQTRQLHFEHAQLPTSPSCACPIRPSSA
jgi:LPS-assembly protein